MAWHNSAVYPKWAGKAYHKKNKKSCLIGNVVTVILEDAYFTQTAVMQITFTQTRRLGKK